MMIMRSITNFSKTIASAIAGFFIAITFWMLSQAFKLHFKLFGKPWQPVTLMQKGMTLEFINAKGLPLPPVLIDEDNFHLTQKQIALGEELKDKKHLETLGQKVDRLIALAVKTYPCEVIANIKKSYALGSTNGGAYRSQEDLAKDEAFTREHKGKETIEGWICEVLECRAKYAAAFNHCDDLNNTEDLHDLLKFNRIASAIAFYLELEEAIKNAKKKFIHAINYISEEVKYKTVSDKDSITKSGYILFFANAQKVKAPFIENICHLPFAGDTILFKGQSLKKSNQADGIAATAYIAPPAGA